MDWSAMKQHKTFDGELVAQLLDLIELEGPIPDNEQAIYALAVKVRETQGVAYACTVGDAIEVTTKDDREPRFINRIPRED
jgi:hypothetical protein